MTDTESFIALNDSITVEMDMEYTISIISNLGGAITKKYLWTETIEKNFSQLPYQLVGVRYTNRCLHNESSF